MKLKKLTFSGLGPFAGTQTIDFTRFEPSGLFLLRGHTGSGKSTIIDAVVFALYGRVARDEAASKDRLRSDFAADSDPTQVELEFDVQGRMYRVTRTPAYQRSDRKNPTKPHASLVQLVTGADGAVRATPLESGVNKVEPEVVKLLGLTADQFLQTVVLPQGDFQRFLTAKSEDRTRILSRIFNAGLQQRVQRILEEKAKTAAQTLVDARAQVSSCADTFMASVEPTGVDTSALVQTIDAATTQVEGNLHENPLIREATLALEDAHQRTAAQRHARDRLDAALKQAQRDLQHGQQLTALLEEKATLLARQDELAASAEQMQQLKESIDQALRAQPASSALTRLRAAQTAVTESQTHVTRVASQVSAAGIEIDADAAPDELAHLAHEAERLATSRIGELKPLLDVELSLPAREAQLLKLTDQRDHDNQDRRKTEEKLDALPLKRRAVDQDLTQQREVAHAQPLRQADVDKLGARLASALKAEEYGTQLESALDDQVRAHQAANQAAEQFQLIHRQWLNGSAASLARQLAEGMPCPVCGSPTHPNPATGDQEAAPSLEEVNAQGQARLKADQALAQAISRVTVLTSQKDQAAAAAGDTAQNLTDQLNQATQLLQQATAAETQVNKLEKTLADLDVEQEHLRQHIHQLDTTIAAGSAAIDAAQHSITVDRERCQQGAQGFDTLAQRSTYLQRQVDVSAALSTSVATLNAATAQQQEAQSALDSALLGAGFATVTELESHVREPDALAEDQARYAAYAEDVSTVAHQLASPRFNVSAQPPDLQTLQQVEAQALNAFTQASEKVGHLEGSITTATTALDALHAAFSTLELAYNTYQPIRRLDAIANVRNHSHENRLQTSLETWFLQARLDTVLAAANPRITQISNGAFELKRTHSDSSKSVSQGLGIVVVDHFTGTQRMPSTLSGGETFYVSLSLALALAHVVTAESGGIEMGSMFIDEGFGSLDPEKLGVVMAQLHDLKASGRVVGVISHVEDMAQSIRDQVIVTKDAQHGSTLRIQA